MHILAAKCFATHPEKTGKLLGQGAIMILRTQPIQKTNPEGGFKMATLAAPTHVGYGAWAVGLNNLPEFGSYFIQGLLPRNALKSLSNTFERKSQSLRVILKISDVNSFSTKITLCPW